MSNNNPSSDARPALDEARAMVRDLFTPRAAIYWPDFLGHAMVGWAALAATVLLPLWSAAFWLAYVVAVIALYRAVIFIHELAHLRPGALPGFRLAWNLLAGVPMMVPSFTYSGVHNHHHKQAAYGRVEDGEYLPFARTTPWLMVSFLLSGLLTPVAVLLRFTVLTPIGWVLPPVQRLLWRHASSLTIDFRYRRGHSPRDDRHWRWQEAGCWLWSVSMLSLMAAGILAWRVLWMWAAVLIGVYIVNGVRTLVAHRYRHDDDQPLDLMQQFHDSVDVPGMPVLTAFWAPVGLRYHATHHLFPSMPYHNLATAHQRLSQGLTDPSWYQQATEPGLRSAILSIWRDARRRRLASITPHQTGSGA